MRTVSNVLREYGAALRLLIAFTVVFGVIYPLVVTAITRPSNETGNGLDPSMQTATGPASPLESLSARERQVLQLVVEGHSSSRIAALVHLAPKSVETYRSRLMKKLGVKDVPALVKFAVEHGLTPPG